MSDLVGNPEDRFSRVAAHMVPVNSEPKMSCSSLMVYHRATALLYLLGFNGRNCASTAGLSVPIHFIG